MTRDFVIIEIYYKYLFSYQSYNLRNSKLPIILYHLRTTICTFTFEYIMLSIILNFK